MTLLYALHGTHLIVPRRVVVLVDMKLAIFKRVELLTLRAQLLVELQKGIVIKPFHATLTSATLT